jgi:hypothetical protein
MPGALPLLFLFPNQPSGRQPGILYRETQCGLGVLDGRRARDRKWDRNRQVDRIRNEDRDLIETTACIMSRASRASENHRIHVD